MPGLRLVCSETGRWYSATLVGTELVIRSTDGAGIDERDAVTLAGIQDLIAEACRNAKHRAGTVVAAVGNAE